MNFEEWLVHLEQRIKRLENGTCPLLRVDDVAAILRVDPRTVRRLHHSGRLETIRIGGSVRFTVDAVAKLVESGRQNPPNPPDPQPRLDIRG